MPTKKTTAKRTRRRTNAPALEAGTAILAGTNYSESQYAKFVLGVEDAKKGIYRLGRARDAGYLVGTSYPRGLNVFTYQFNPNRFVAEDQREYLRWVPEGEGPNEGHWEFVERSPTSGRWKKAMQTVRNIRVIPSETVIETWDMTT